MSDLNLTSFNPLYPMRIHPYKELLNDSNVNIMDKVNAVIDYLNQVGKLTNDVVKDWNTVYQWVMNDGLTTDVNNKIESMKANGELQDLLNTIFNSLTGDMTTLHTTLKDTIVNALNEVDDLAKSNQSQLAQKAQQSDLLLKADKSYVDTQIGNIGNASPKGTYTSLSALQSAYPTGTTGIYLTTDTGHWYYWNGSAWTDGGVYQSTGIADGSITGKQTNFMSVGKNLFNLATVTNDYYILYSNGTLQASTGYFASDYIAVQPNTTYTRYICRQMAFYDSNKTYISGINTTGATPFTFTTPANTAYIRISMNGTTELNNEQVEIGSTRTAYESFKYVINTLNLPPIDTTQLKDNSVSTSKLQDKGVTLNKLGVTIVGNNLFNASTITDNNYINYANGLLLSNTSYAVSDYIAILPSTSYSASHNRDLAFYDANKTYISGIDDAGIPAPKIFTTPSNASFLRISIKKSVTPVSSFMVNQGSSLLPYEPYSLYLDPNQIKVKQTDATFTNDFCLPSTLYMLNGALNHLYVEPIIKRWRPYNDHIRFSGSVPFSRRYSRLMEAKYPVDGNTLTVDLINSDKFTTIKEVTSTVLVGNANTGTTPVYAQIIGDSYTYGEFFKDALITKGYVPNLHLVGLRKVSGTTGQYNEGRGGWTLNQYMGVTTDPLNAHNPFFQPSGSFRYWGATGFWKNCYGVINGTLTDFTSTYNCGGFDDYVNKFDSSTGFLTSPSEGDVMYDTTNSTYKVFTSGAWANTTYATYTWGFDYSKYLSMWNITAPSTLFVMLGLNDFRDNYGADFSTWNSQIMTVKSSYLTANPSGKFVICIPCSTTGSDDNVTGDFTTKQHAAMWNFRSNLITTFDNRTAESIYLLDVGATIDSQYGYNLTTVDWDTLPYDGYTGTDRLKVQKDNPHPYPNYPIMGVPLAAFLQKYRT